MNSVILRIILYIFPIIVFSGKCIGQMPFAQANQTSMLFNPSLAGSKDKKRISLAWNQATVKPSTENNYFISYDQIVQKLGAGIGAYYLYQQNENEKASDFLPERLQFPFVRSSLSHRAGISIAPKFNIMDRLNPNKIKYTISPSIFIDYQSNEFKQNGSYYFYNYQNWSYKAEYPRGSAVSDSVVTSFEREKVDSKIYGLGFGLHFYSEKFFVLYRFRYGIDQSYETQENIQYSNVTEASVINKKHYASRLYSIDQTLTFGTTFPSNKEAQFSFTPIGGIGFSSYLNLDRKAESKYPATSSLYNYSHYVLNKKPSQWHYAHASANFRFRKVLFGGAYSKSYHMAYYGATLGYQFPWLRIMTSLSASNGFFAEVSANVTLF